MTRARPIPDTITVHVPFRFVTRGGRKEMQLPAGGALQRKTDNTLVKALARAFRWARMLESGEFATIGDLAAQEKIAPSYMTRVMRLTQLAPEIVEAIVEGRDAAPGLAGLLEPFPVEWTEQLYEPPRVYRRVICSTTRRPYRLCSGLHRTPPLLLRV